MGTVRWPANAKGIGLLFGLSACKAGDDLLFEDANNYTFSNEVTMQVTEIAANEDARIDWSGLTTDVRGRAVGGVQQISMLKFKYPLDELVPLFATNDIDAQAEAEETYLFEVAPGVDEAMASTFDITGVGFSPEDLFTDDPTATWTVSAVNYPGGRLDLLMSKAFVPTGASTNHDITLADGDTEIEYTVDLHSAPQLEVDAGVDSYVLDWSAVTTDVFDHPYDPVAGDDLLIGHYPGDLASVEAGFLQLDTNADRIYRRYVGSETSAALSEAADEAGAAFPGFDATGTWLIGISCSACSTPVPLLLTVISVR
ncbi:MAG: hypothetical protein ABMA64_09875 [Myxococcota bacterium]